MEKYGVLQLLSNEKLLCSNSECKIFNSVKVHKQKLKAHLSYFLTKPGKILIKLLFFQYIAPFRKNEVNSEFRSRISPIDHSNLT